MPTMLRRMLFGQPLATARAEHERLPKLLALPIFASDALSSCAYATEEILLALLLAGTAAFRLSVPIAIGIAVLLAIVAFSYRQTVLVYTSGGGAYIVAKDNLGTLPATTAGAALLIDYILTVSVSVAAGVAALTSTPALAAWRPHTIPICVGFILLIAIANLRGVRESGMLFAFPTYLFITVMVVMIGTGLWRYMSGLPPVSELHQEAEAGTHSLGWFLVLRAFASGCAALTGVEAISNGVQAFRKPEGRNAAATMVWMAVILTALFLGITYLAWAWHARYPHQIIPHAHGGETIVSQVARTALGTGPLYYLIQLATATILILAANTSFAGFPRLSALLAHDGFLPRQLANIGDKLVYNNGIIVLAALASLLIIIFAGSTHLLIPLYAVGVFLSFTISQTGMVKRWLTRREKGWRAGAVINTIGAVATGIVLIVITLTKFIHGAWVVVFLIPTIIMGLYRIHDHYVWLKGQLSLEGYCRPQPLHNTVLVLAPTVHRGVIPALQYACTISDDVRAVNVEINPEYTQKLRAKWRDWGEGVPLVVLESPYRSLIDPILQYIDQVDAERDDDVITVIIPEFVTPRIWDKILHNHSGLMLKFALLFKKNIIVCNVRYWVEKENRARCAPPRTPAGSPRSESEGARPVKGAG
jgi:amino acid transporter